MKSISVVIPAHNRAHCIGDAVRSVLSEQDYPIHELLVIDDGSSDDLAGALRPFGPKVSLIRHETNQGASAARNTGINTATGEFIAFLDTDDTWKKGKLRHQLAFMESQQFRASCTGFETVGVERASAPVVAWRPYPARMGLGEHIWGCYVSPGSTLICQRELLERIGGYNTAFPRYEDWDLLLRLSGSTDESIGFLDEPLATIVLGSQMMPAQALTGLNKMRDEHLARMETQDKTLARRFKSALAFNAAAVHQAAGMPVKSLWELGRCFYLNPLNNWPMRVILGGKLRAKLRWRNLSTNAA